MDFSMLLLGFPKIHSVSLQGRTQVAQRRHFASYRSRSVRSIVGESDCPGSSTRILERILRTLVLAFSSFEIFGELACARRSRTPSSAGRPKQGSFWAHYSTRSFAIYNLEERKKPPPGSDASRGSLGEMKYAARREKSPRKARSHPFVFYPCLSRVGFPRWRRQGARSPNKRRKFQLVLLGESYLIERECERASERAPSCSRVSTVALSRKKGVRSNIRKFARRRKFAPRAHFSPAAP